MLARRWLLCVLIFIAPSLLLAQWTPNQLKQVVILTRHGVRSPLSPMSDYSKDQTWPDIHKAWQVTCCGDLTPRGKALVKLMGGYYRAYYSAQGLLPAKSCLANQVYIWADNEERTIGTANQLAIGLDGSILGCKVAVNSLKYTPTPCPDGCQRTASNDAKDLWFHPLPGFWKDRVTPDDRKAIQDAADGLNNSERYQQLLSTYGNALQALQKTLNCCRPTLCPQQPSCSLMNLPHTATVGTSTDSSAISWKSPFSVGSTASEVFLLEYAHGMPCDIVGWGKVVFDGPDCARSGASFRQMQEIHTAYFQLVQRPLIVAQIQGTNLLNQILSELQTAVDSKGAQPRKLVIFSGHDTNIANVAALLNLSWTLPDLPKDDTPPAGALVFELYSDYSPDAYYVRIRYVHQTVWQLRKSNGLSPLEAPAWSDLRLPDCSGACPFVKFKQITGGKILPRFVSGHTLEE